MGLARGLTEGRPEESVDTESPNRDPFNGLISFYPPWVAWAVESCDLAGITTGHRTTNGLIGHGFLLWFRYVLTGLNPARLDSEC